MTTEHEVRALLAERYADIVDRGSRSGDGATVIRAGEKLLEVMDTLPIRPEGGTPGDGSGSDRGRVLSILDGPPQVGDTAHA